MMDQKQREKCLQEVKLLQSVDHPNIVKYLDSFISENELYIAIEWADKGDLKKFIKKTHQEGDKIDEFRIIEYTKQIGAALLHMHEKRIIHRDLKPANILIFSDGTFKLGDLGLGRYMSDETFKAFSKVGTPLYMSPEVIRNDGYDFKSDVWSLGCVIYELITFKSPFRTDDKISLYDLFTKINKGDYPKVQDEKYGPFITELVDKMLLVNPEERISLEEVT
jgi:serine/threonine protein kinase